MDLADQWVSASNEPGSRVQAPEDSKKTDEERFEALLEQMARMGAKSSDLEQLREGRAEMKAAKQSGSRDSETDPEIKLPLSSSRETIAYGDAEPQKEKLAKVEEKWGKKPVKLAKALDVPRAQIPTDRESCAVGTC